jgi:malate dehydrogenase (oxaloacetate-decarboxylating)
MSDNESCGELPIPVSGRTLLEQPLLNKGTAFTERERIDFRLLGLLPPHVETIEEQCERAWEEFLRKDEDLQRHIYLRQLQDENETLFYRLMQDHIEELTPIVYTPVVGRACERFGHIFRRPRGLYVSYPQRGHIDRVLANVERDIEVIVVTDGERILGLGDQGAGGMGIPIGKLSLYTLCGGIDPARTLPVLLDVGTDNQERLADPRYQGWRHERIRGEEYDAFVEEFVQAVLKRFPLSLLQWEDFASANAEPLLARYRNRLCTFNDDIQGTAAVILGTILAAVKAKKEKLTEQVFLGVGSGSAGFGAALLLRRVLQEEGLGEEEARRRVLMADSRGLLFCRRDGVTPLKEQISQAADFQPEWRGDDGHVSVHAISENARPTVVFGATGKAGTFDEDLVRSVAARCERPVIMPLSNPTSRAEAVPADLLEWTEGRALIATGSPFAPVQFRGQTRRIAQCNNVYIFPAMGLGVRAVNARRVTDSMFMAAARALAETSPALEDVNASLLPPLPEIREVADQIATAVARCAQEEGIADLVGGSMLQKRIRSTRWAPCYREYVPG